MRTNPAIWLLTLFAGVALSSWSHTPQQAALALQSAPPQGAAGRGASSPTDGASVFGSVVGNADQPIAGLTVRALSRTLVAGDPAARYTTASTTRTGARGEYRFTLPAGDYIVDVPLTQTTMPASIAGASAAGRSAGAGDTLIERIADSMGPPPYFTGTRIGAFVFQTMGPQGPAPAPPPADGNDVRVYRATIFPNASTTREALVVKLGATDVFRAEIRLVAVRGRRVSGTLTGPKGEVAHIALRLLPVLDDRELFRDGDFEQAVTVSDEAGGFTFLGVPPGRYTLKALYVPSVLPGDASGGRGVPARVGSRGGGSPTEPAMDFVRWAETTVAVDDADVTGLEVPLNPPVRVTGRIAVSAATPAAVDLSQARIMLLSNRPVTIAPPAPFVVAADGTFSARLYGPGRYSAQVSGVPGFVVGGLSVQGVAAPDRWLRVPAQGLDGVALTLSTQLTVRLVASPGRAGSTPASAAPPPPSPDNGFVAGRVIDGTTGEPVRDATVGLQPSAGLASARRVVTTDSTGAFTFGDAIAGSYSVTASAPGYSASAFGKLREDGGTSTLGLAARERVTAMLIRMWKTGQVSGRVRDEGGKPVDGLNLVALHVTQSGPAHAYTLASAAMTDSTGAYRFESLPPGRYLVCASFTPTTVPASLQQADSALTALLVESRAPVPGPAGVLIGAFRFLMGSPSSTAAPMPMPVSPAGDIHPYRSTCYPAAETLSDATMLTVHAGDDRNGVDLTLRASPTVRVSGTLRGPNGPMPNVGLRLVRVSAEAVAGSERLEAAVTISGERGAFTFLGVPPGRYLLRAWTTHVDGETPPAAPPNSSPRPRPTGVTLWAEVSITVAGSDVSDLAVTLAPTARVSGRLVVEGPGQPATPVSLRLVSQSADPPSPLAAQVAGDGTFVLRGYAPGRYRLPMNVPINTVPAARIVSATLNGKPLPSDTIDLGLADVSNLVLTATDRFTTLTGQIARESGLGAIGATVCIFPADYGAWIADGMPANRLRSFRASGSWTYTATWLPPGDYLALVYREADGADLTPAFVERLAKLAIKVTLRDGEKATLDLRVVDIR